MGATVSIRARSVEEKRAVSDMRCSIPGGLYFSTGLLIKDPTKCFSRQEQIDVLRSCEATIKQAKNYFFDINEELGLAADTCVCNMSCTFPTEATEIRNCVDKCWEQIQIQSDTHQSKKSIPNAERRTTKNWQVIRLFVSSTFRDFHSEREVLVKKVFPELRDWCAQRHLQFIDCDLRWGVPRDSTTRTTICTCLDEIKRCHDETDGNGFFLNMLGERYGWVPNKEAVPDNLTKQYDWVHGTSVTHMEIVRGAYVSKNPNSLFLIRDPSFLEGLAEEQKAWFVDDAEYCKVQLQELKHQIREKFTEQVFDYSCQVDSIENGKVKMLGLEETFAKTVLDFFKSAISKQYPETNVKKQIPEEIEKEQHQIFMEQRGAMVFGRDKDIQKMLTFAKDRNGSGSSPMLIVADPGQGKSALMAKCVIDAEQNGLNVFYHFVGCTGQSTNASHLVYRLCEVLAKPDSNEKWKKVKENFDYKEAVELLAELLKEFGKTDEQLLILIDAVNQLVQNEDYLSWIPVNTFGSLKFVLSTTREGNVLEEIDKQVPSSKKLNLEELDESAKMDVVQNYFARYNKKLDPEQLALLVQSKGSSNVLWLSLVCEELRIFGVFEEVTQRIKTLDPSLEGLISEIIQRIINEDETTFVEQILCLLECSRAGLKETELHFMLGDCESDEPVAMLPWSQARRTLMPFLRNSSGWGGEQRLDFFHASIKKAVRQSLLVSPEKQEVQHLRLAEFFQYHAQDDDRVVQELPYQLKKAGKTKRLVDFLREDARARKMGKFAISNMLQDVRCQRRMLIPGPFVSVIKICVFCENFKGGVVKRALWPNKDICVLCGERVNDFQRKRNNEAMLCMEHSRDRLGNKDKCCVCKKPIFGSIRASPMYICMMCSMGSNSQRCAKLITKE